MPLVAFEGKIVVVSTLSEAEKACEFLCKQNIVGIDTETKPSFHKGVSHKVALLQVSTEDICFLFSFEHYRFVRPRKEIYFKQKDIKSWFVLAR